MNLALKITIGFALSLAAKVVCLVYRKGWFNTPDDPVSPYGMYEPRLRKMYAHLPAWLVDYYWLGWRNSAYGWAYAQKPQHFKDLTTYDNCRTLCLSERTWHGRRRVIFVDDYKEVTYFIGRGKYGVHVITGLRLRPVFDQWYNNRFLAAAIPYRPVNMDARPIFSIRAGMRDD